MLLNRLRSLAASLKPYNDPQQSAASQYFAHPSNASASANSSLYQASNYSALGISGDAQINQGDAARQFAAIEDFNADASLSMSAQLPSQLATAHAHIHAAIGGLIFSNRETLRSKGKSVHFICGGTLVAMLDPATMVVVVRRDLHGIELGQLFYAIRPKGAVAIAGAQFQRSDVWSLVWRFGQTHAEALAHFPKDWMLRPLQLARLPSVAVNLLEARHYILFRLFARGETTLAELQNATGIAHNLLLKDLTSLFMVRALRAL